MRTSFANTGRGPSGNHLGWIAVLGVLLGSMLGPVIRPARADATSSPPAGGLRSAETIDWIHQYVETLMHGDELGGKILVARGNLTLFQRSIGYVDARRSLPVMPETRFELGSGTKMLTAIVTMLLVEEGRIQLDDPIGPILPTFPDADLGERITVRQLLSHSSGLGSDWETAGDGVRFEPGTQHRYSDSGYLLLGRVIEEVTGEDFVSVVRRRILEPLGMTHTDFCGPDEGPTDLAPRLVRPAAGEEETSAIWITGPSAVRGTSSEGSFSTPPDLLRLVRALVGGTLVRPETLAEMTTPQPPFASADDPYEGGHAYGLGLLLERSDTGTLSWGHEGFAPGVNFELRHFPADDVTFVLFCNQENDAFDELNQTVRNIITGDR
ncbi:MAG: serine hydrolase domain-containing protein [Candidatus Eisenbacteria bacterium]